MDYVSFSEVNQRWSELLRGAHYLVPVAKLVLVIPRTATHCQPEAGQPAAEATSESYGVTPS